MKKLFNKTLLYTSVTTLIFNLSTMVSFADGEDIETGTIEASQLEPIVDFINFWMGVGSIFATVLAFGAFVFNIIRLGSSSTNARMRENAIRGLILSGAASMLIPVSGLIFFSIIGLVLG